MVILGPITEDEEGQGGDNDFPKAVAVCIHDRGASEDGTDK